MATTSSTTMPSMSSKLDVLRAWLVSNGGRIHPDVALAYDERSGVHCRASTDLAADTSICSVPHAIALSSLNALVDDKFTAFRNRGIPVEAIGHFYLVHQYINEETSFWKPYLDTLPSPEHGHSTPFWFDDEDLTWLADTDVYYTTVARQASQRANYDKGLKVLERAQVDTTPYTWPLFLWAITIFTSRSFSSRALHPDASKYWAAHKHGSDGRRQTVLMDMSRVSSVDLDFPVLFPVVDIPNHLPDAKMNWSYDPGLFSIALAQPVGSGSEIYNNYGPKGNDELLLGYGFCLPHNPFDKVLLTLKEPALALQKEVRAVHAGYFTQDGVWSSEKATFGIGVRRFDKQDPSSLFAELPEPLLELLLYILRDERGLQFTFTQHPLMYLTSRDSVGRRYQPHLVRAMVQSLAPKLSKLNSAELSPPKNHKQEQAKIYRDGQIEILTSVINACRHILRHEFRPSSLNVEDASQRGLLYTLEDILAISAQSKHQGRNDEFLTGIAQSAGSSNVLQLRQAGWEEDMLALLLCFLTLDGWMQTPLPEYLIDGTDAGKASSVDDQTSTDEDEQARGLLDIVRTAALRLPGSLWHDERWSASFIAHHGGNIIKYDSFMMMLPRADVHSAPTEEARLVVYLHCMAQHDHVLS